MTEKDLNYEKKNSKNPITQLIVRLLRLARPLTRCQGAAIVVRRFTQIFLDIDVFTIHNLRPNIIYEINKRNYKTSMIASEPELSTKM